MKNTSGNPDAIAAACRQISDGDVDRARKIISSEYPFVPFADVGRKYSDYQKKQWYTSETDSLTGILETGSYFPGPYGYFHI